MVNRQKMEAQLILHEGVILHPYPDSDDPPNWTLGVGYNITARGLDGFQRVIKRKLKWTPPASFHGYSRVDLITRPEALQVLDVDIDRVEHVILAHFPDYAALDEVRQRVCVDMTFNMGEGGAFAWKNTIAAVQRRDWTAVAKALYRSKWIKEVGDKIGERGGRLAQMALTGKDYTS